MSILETLLNNHILVAGICGWSVAQVLKTIIYALIHKEIRWERLMGDGGMPSGHSATVSAMACMSALEYGLSSFEFAITTMVAIIVMHDAMGVRLETGKQAKIINEMMEIFRNVDSKKILPTEKLKEFVGHTPIQVGAGCILGLIVSFIIH